LELFKLLGTISVDNQPAIKALDDTAKKAGVTSEETSEAFRKIGSVAGTIAKGVFTAGAAIGGAWLAAIEGSREYRTEMGKLETAFVTNGHSAESAKQTYSDLNAVLGDSGQAVEASQHLAKLTDNEKDLQTWTNICTGVYATFGESLPIEGLTEAANETAKTGLLTGGLTDALNWAGISEEAFQEKLDKCSNEQERQKLIMDTLNGTYSKASEQYKETNKDVLEANKAQERLTDAFAELGRIGEPILTAIKEGIAKMAEAAIPHLENFIQKVKDIIKWVKENKDTIDIWVGVIIGAGTAIGIFLLILNWGAIMAAATKAVKGVTLAVKALNLAMKANLIGLIVSAIIGLVAAFIYLWNNVDGFREFWKKTWETIKKATSAAWTFIKKWFSDAWNYVKKIWNAAPGFFKGLWTGIKSIFNSVKSWFSDKFKSAWNGVKSIWNGAKSFFSGIWSSIKNTFSSVQSYLRGKFQAAWSSIKSVFSGWGSFFGGLWTKIKSKFSSIGTSLGTSMGNAVKNGLNRVISTVQSAINKGIGLINSAITLANKLPGINVGKVPKISLPRLAKGGVLEKGQVGVLEGSGAEAVVPLEHNRKWLGKVAEDLYELQSNSFQDGNSSEIVMLLDRIATLIQELKKMKICLDSGAMVGELVPAIDTRLSDRWNHAMRGNTR
jgi:phage-related protein